jgi:hypothetical protein
MYDDFFVPNLNFYLRLAALQQKEKTARKSQLADERNCNNQQTLMCDAQPQCFTLLTICPVYNASGASELQPDGSLINCRKK